MTSNIVGAAEEVVAQVPAGVDRREVDDDVDAASRETVGIHDDRPCRSLELTVLAQDAEVIDRESGNRMLRVDAIRLAARGHRREGDAGENAETCNDAPRSLDRHRDLVRPEIEIAPCRTLSAPPPANKRKRRLFQA